MSLQVTLENQSTSSEVYVTIEGLDADNGNQLCFIQSDGKTQYFPANPSANMTPLAQDVAIQLGAPGSSTVATIPHLVSGRVWFSIGAKIVFSVNPGGNGPALVQPDVNNPQDPNANINFSFAEFTYNTTNLVANITYVDLVGIPNAITITDTSNQTQHVGGLPADGLQQVVSQLQAQSSSDSQPWGSLYENNLRVVSPNNYIVQNSGAFSGYFEPYVNSCWQKFASTPAVVNLSSGDVNGTTTNNVLTFADGSGFAQPSTADVFNNSSGPFTDQGASDEKKQIRTILAAALNRTTLLDFSPQPNGAQPSDYYQKSPTNHYARILHAINVDGRGYAFPFDDVVPAGGADQAGLISSPNPQMFTVTIGGGNATADLEVVKQRQAVLLAKAQKVAGMSVAEQAKLTEV